MSKKFSALLLILVILLAGLPASAEEHSHYPGFYPVHVNKGMSIPVYSAPSTDAWRGAGGKAACGTDGPFYAAGREGNWAWIVYSLNRGENAGAWRTGYVQISELKGLQEELKPFSFHYLNATLNVSAYLTDDPNGRRTPITYLSAGTSLIYLIAYGDFAYVQTVFEGKIVRGFVPDCCSVTVHVPRGQYTDDYCRNNFARYDFVN